MQNNLPQLQSWPYQWKTVSPLFLFPTGQAGLLISECLLAYYCDYGRQLCRNRLKINTTTLPQHVHKV